MSKQKTKTLIFGIIAIIILTISIVLCFVFIPKALSKNSELDMSNADYTNCHSKHWFKVLLLA